MPTMPNWNARQMMGAPGTMQPPQKLPPGSGFWGGQMQGIKPGMGVDPNAKFPSMGQGFGGQKPGMSPGFGGMPPPQGGLFGLGNKPGMSPGFGQMPQQPGGLQGPPQQAPQAFGPPQVFDAPGNLGGSRPMGGMPQQGADPYAGMSGSDIFARLFQQR
jgi:hypothetical protein